MKKSKKIFIAIIIIIIAAVLIWRIFFPNLFAESVSTSELSQGSTLLNSESRILVAYFSRIGNTQFDTEIDAVSSASVTIYDGENLGNCEVAARISQDITSGDIFFIETAEKYPGDFDATSEQTSQEKSADTRPELNSHVENMDNYNTIILVTPIWWGDLPQPVVTFLEEYDFSEKTIIPISTNEGSGLGSIVQEITSLCPEAQIAEGLSISGNAVSTAKESITECLEKAGVIQ